MVESSLNPVLGPHFALPHSFIIIDLNACPRPPLKLRPSQCQHGNKHNKRSYFQADMPRRTPSPTIKMATPTFHLTLSSTQYCISRAQISTSTIFNAITNLRISPRRLLDSTRPGVSMSTAVFGLVFLKLAPGFHAFGEYHYVLDTTSFRLAPYASGHATVFGYFQNKTPTPEYGLSVPYCPRTLLGRITERAKRHAGVSYLVGFESEFTLLSATAPKIIPVNTADWSVSSKLPSGSVEAQVLEEIALKLEEASIELQMYHAEAAPGQYEIVTGPLPPLQAADAIVQTHETIFNVASKHGLRATFAPRLFSTSCGSSMHTHISIHDEHPTKSSKRNDTQLGPTMTNKERSFLQGVLDHAPAIAAFTLPTTYSYGRVADGVWSGGTYVSWGTDQREAPVRLTGARGRHHLEIRFVDGTASPYLVLASLIGAGTEAIISKALLKTGDCGIPVAQMNDEQKAKARVQNAARFPQTIEHARKNLAGDSLLKDVFTADFIDKYIGVNATLERLLVADSEDETVTKLVNFY